MVGYYTVVYRVDGDAAAQNAWWQSIRPLFMAGEDIPISVMAISKADEIARLVNIERIVEGCQSDDEKLEAIKAVLLAVDPCRTEAA